MKIAMIGQKGIPARAGGIERHVEELSSELAARGHEVLVFCRSWYVWPIREHRGVRCIATTGIRTKHLDAITHTLTSIWRAAREKADVFHFHGVGPALLAWLPKLLRPSAQVLVTFHCIDRHHQKWNALARAMLWLGEWMACRIPSATVTVSKTLTAYCHLTFGVDPVYIPNGTHIPVKEPDLSPLSLFTLEPNRYLLMCSRLVKHKGAHTLIRAWKYLSATQPKLVRNRKLAIVGSGSFTDQYVKELKDLVGSDPTIILTGLQTGDALAALFAGSYAVVHPSESEGLPIAVLEAMSYGKCVLASDIPENTELLERQGLQFMTGSVKDLADHMAMMLEQPELVAAVGRDARAFVAKHYDWHDIGEQISYLYEALTYIPNLKEAKS